MSVVGYYFIDIYVGLCIGVSLLDYEWELIVQFVCQDFIVYCCDSFCFVSWQNVCFLIGYSCCFFENGKGVDDFFWYSVAIDVEVFGRVLGLGSLVFISRYIYVFNVIFFFFEFYIFIGF